MPPDDEYRTKLTLLLIGWAIVGPLLLVQLYIFAWRQGWILDFLVWWNNI